MSDSQVIDADRNDHVQNNDLAKEHDVFLGTLGAEEMPNVRGGLRRPQHCAWMPLSLADIAAKHSYICRRISMLFRQQSRHATAPNTTTSMTDVFYYRTAIITATLVVD